MSDLEKEKKNQKEIEENTEPDAEAENKKTFAEELDRTEIMALVSKKRSRRPWIALSIVVVIALAFMLGRFQAQNVMAKEAGNINGVKITQAELYDEMIRQLGEQPGQILDNLIMTKLIGMEAEKAKVKVTDADVDAELKEIKKSIPSEEQFNAILEQNNLTLDDLKKQLISQIQIRKIFEPQIPMKNEDLHAYFDGNKESLGTPEQIRASHILLQTKDEAEAALARLKNGADFAELAKELTVDTASKDNGGDLEFFSRGRMNPQFEEAAFKLNKGEISDVVESPNGFHIIKVTDKKSAQIPTFEEKKEEVKKRYFDEQLNTLLPEWLDKISKGADIQNPLKKSAAPAFPQ